MLRSLLWGDSAEEKESLLTRIKKHPFRFLIIVLCLINITLIAINIGLWIIAAYQKLFFAADFTSFYTGFYLVRVGEGRNLFDRALQSFYQQQFMGGMTFEGGVLLFPNPPFVAIVFSPLSFFRLDIAFYIWTVMQVGLLIWCLVRLNQVFHHWEKQERIVLIITILAFWPLTNSLLLGQFSIFLLICVVQLYEYMKNSSLIKAGVWLALMTVKPQTLLIPGMMTLNKRYWCVAATAAIAGLVLFVSSSIILGIHPWIQYIHSLRALGSYFGKYGVDPKTEYTFRGVLSNILGNSQGNQVNSISIIVLLIGMMIVWLIWRKDIPQNNPKFRLYFAFTIFLSVFFSLHLNPHDSLLLVFPAALFYDYLRQSDHPRNAYSIILLISPMVFFLTAFTEINVFGIILPPIILMMIIMIWIIKYMIMEYRSDQNYLLSNNS
jgi:Glycosyltransferase family 87